ncbi:hypothetical protein HY468_01865 [Candidatus Roizmanbacteria bacterium]|nr:hypothetical protein [Candidatus Roizmanbacteria bacterium]
MLYTALFGFMDQEPKSPVIGWTPIPTPQPDADLPLMYLKSPEAQESINQFLQQISDNLKTLTENDLSRIDFSLFSDAKYNTESRHTKLFILQSAARGIIDASQTPKDLANASKRNAQLATSNISPITPYSFLHGLPLDCLQYVKYGLLAGELYGGRGNVLPMRLYLSRIVPTYQVMSDLTSTVRNSNSERYGVGPGKVTLVAPPEASFVKNLPNAPSAGSTTKSASIPYGLPIGAPSYDISACVVTAPEDIDKTIKTLKTFPLYIPVYDGRGNLQFTPEQWQQRG